jgi:hypothetical protein
VSDEKPTPKLTAEQRSALFTATREQLAGYQCVLAVRAARIKEVIFGYDQVRDRNTTLLVPEDPRLAPIEVGKDFVAKHDPKGVGYFMVDHENEEHWMDVASFEKGFQLTDEAQPQDIKAILLTEEQPPEAA